MHGVANCLYSLGDVRLLGSPQGESHKRDAKKYYDDALRRYKEIGLKLGPANCHQGAMLKFG